MKKTVIFIICVISLHSSINQAFSEDSKVNDSKLHILLWKNAKENFGWIILDSKYSLISSIISVNDNVPVHLISTRDLRASENIIVNIELSPISVQVSSSTSGYAVRITRKNQIVSLDDVSLKEMYDKQNDVIFLSGIIVKAGFIAKLEEGDGKNISLDYIKMAINDEYIKVNEIIDSSEPRKVIVP